MQSSGDKVWLVVAAGAALLALLAAILVPADLLDRWDTGRPHRHVLFIGNAYTSDNALPEMLAVMASSDAGAPFRFDVDIVAFDDATLTDHWQRVRARKALEERNWHQVILQEQGLWAMSVEGQAATYTALQNWAAEIKRSGAQPLFLATWARQPDSHWYISDPLAPVLRDPDSMQGTIDLQADWAAGRAGIPVAHAGRAWQAVWRLHPEINLYQEDGTRPSMAGSYLTALVLYRTLTNRPPTAVTWAPPGVSDDQARVLRQEAAR